MMFRCGGFTVEQYAVVYTKTEEIGLVRKERLAEYNAMLKRITR